MGNRQQHCRPISKSAPVAAQTSSLNLKLNMITGFMDQALSMQRSKPWGIIFPIIGGIGGYDEVGTGGTGGDTGTDVTGDTGTTGTVF